MSNEVLVAIIGTLVSVLGISIGYIIHGLTVAVKELKIAIETIKEIESIRDRKMALMEQSQQLVTNRVDSLSDKVDEHDRLIDRLRTANNTCPTSALKI